MVSDLISQTYVVFIGNIPIALFWGLFMYLFWRIIKKELKEDVPKWITQFSKEMENNRRLEHALTIRRS